MSDSSNNQKSSKVIRFRLHKRSSNDPPTSQNKRLKEPETTTCGRSQGLEKASSDGGHLTGDSLPDNSQLTEESLPDNNQLAEGSLPTDSQLMEESLAMRSVNGRENKSVSLESLESRKKKNVVGKGLQPHLASTSHNSRILTIPSNIEQLCLQQFKLTPKEDQLKVLGHISQGEDCILIAGCGWGKSLVYFLPAVIWESWVTVIISPLRALMGDQLQKLNDLGIKSISLSDTKGISKELMHQLSSGKFRIVFMTPESVYKSKVYEELWTDPRWLNRVRIVVFDEAHCISIWGKEFRKSYSRLQELRPKLHPHTSFVALSATLPPETLADVKKAAGFRTPTPVINIGNDRPNVRLEVRIQKKSIKDRLRDLLYILHDQKKTIVYFDNRKLVVKAYYFLYHSAPEGLKERIGAVHATLSSQHNENTFTRFKNGQHLILLSTEATGMGCDIPDVIRVIQYGVPTSMLSLVQRIGRAARDQRLNGYGILLAPPQVDDKYEVKKYIKYQECRRKFLNEYFENPDSKVTNDNCCDICHPQKNENCLVPDSDILDENEAIPELKNRTPDHKLKALAIISSWRTEVFKNSWKGCESFFSEDHVLDNRMVSILANKFSRIIRPGVIKKIVTWEFPHASDLIKLESALIKLNNLIDTEARYDNIGYDHHYDIGKNIIEYEDNSIAIELAELELDNNIGELQQFLDEMVESNIQSDEGEQSYNEADDLWMLEDESSDQESDDQESNCQESSDSENDDQRDDQDKTNQLNLKVDPFNDDDDEDNDDNDPDYIEGGDEDNDYGDDDLDQVDEGSESSFGSRAVIKNENVQASSLLELSPVTLEGLDYYDWCKRANEASDYDNYKHNAVPVYCRSPVPAEMFPDSLPETSYDLFQVEKKQNEYNEYVKEMSRKRSQKREEDDEYILEMTTKNNK